jgi:hypothetical protein
VQGDVVELGEKKFSTDGALSTDAAIKLLVTSGLVLVALALLTLLVRPGQYEIDIYAAAPWFWIFILAAASAFIASIIWQAYCKNYNSFTLSFLGLVLCNLGIFCLPILRGYFYYGGSDPSGHLATIRAILATGYFTGDYYPVGHIIAAEITQVTSLPPQTSMSLVVPLFSIVFAVFIYCLATTVFAKREQVLMATVIGFLPFFSYFQVAFYPQSVALLLFPVVLYLLFKSPSDLRFSALVVPVLLLETFAHPVISMILVACLFGAFLAARVAKARGLVPITRLSLTVTLIGLTLWFGWWTAQTAVSDIGSVIKWLRGETATIPRTAELGPALQGGLWSAAQLALKMYGIQVIFSVIAIIGIGLILLQYYRRQRGSSNAFIIVIASVTSVAAYAFAFLSEGLITLGRLFAANAGFWSLPILAALPLSLVNKKKVGVLLISVFIASAFIFGSFAVFRSPWISQPNWQFTYADAAAYQWDTLVATSATGYSAIAMPMPLSGAGGESVKQVSIPPHFGYDNNTTFGESLGGNETLILFGEQQQRLVSDTPALSGTSLSGIWGLSGTTETDINKLQYDQTVNVIYVNGDSEMLWVR